MTSRLDRLIAASQANIDFPEKFHDAAMRWAKLDGKAHQLEELKTAVLAKKAKALGGDLSVAAAEREVRAGQEWHDFVSEITQARIAANEAKGEMDYWRMKFQAWLVAQDHAREQAA